MSLYGFTNAEVGKLYRISGELVADIANGRSYKVKGWDYAGLKRKAGDTNRSPLTPAEEEAIREAYGDGVAKRQLMKMHKLGAPRLLKILKANPNGG